MSVAVITGSAGLVGSETARHFAGLGFDIVGIDNDMRKVFFGPAASTVPTRHTLENDLGKCYRHQQLDIRDREAVLRLFARYAASVELVVHAAAQPSHDWSARAPFIDFDTNAVGTLNLLEATRLHAPAAVFIFMSTNKVYGDRPNQLPLHETETRWEIDPTHRYANGIREDMSVDASLHSPFGASKLAADILTQEYGRYFGLRTACFRGGTLTGPCHAAAELHGFLAYLMQCAMTRTPYIVHGYGGKQVRDAIHSRDLVTAFEAFFRSPQTAEVYNIGGGRSSNVSVIEAIKVTEGIVGEELSWKYSETNRIGDHIWWIGDNGRFESHYPAWRLTRDVWASLDEIYEANADKWVPTLHSVP